MKYKPTTAVEAAIFTKLSTLKTRNIEIESRRTSVRLEPQIWAILHEISENEKCTVHELCSYISSKKHPNSSLTSAIRVFVISYLHISLQDTKRKKKGGWDAKAILSSEQDTE